MRVMLTMDGLLLRIWRPGVSNTCPLHMHIHPLTYWLSRLSKLLNSRRDLLPNLWPRVQPTHISLTALARGRHCLREPPNLHAIRFPRLLQRIAVRMVQP